MTKILKNKLKNDVMTVAKVGVYLDDPYGDGIRLDSIREPRPARIAALATLKDGINLFDNQLIMDEYLEATYEFLKRDMKRKNPRFPMMI